MHLPAAAASACMAMALMWTRCSTRRWY